MSLIELVVAMAIFALIAVMGVQSLTGSIRVRDRLVKAESDTAELGYALALLRHDLRAVVPMLFYPPDGSPRSAVDLAADTRSLGLSLEGLAGPSATDAVLPTRVEWQFDPIRGTLARRIWPGLSPTQASAVSPESLVLSGVEGLGMRSYWPDGGWREGTAPAQPQSADLAPTDGDTSRALVPDTVSSSLPLAVEVTLETRAHGRVSLLETLQ